MPKKTRLYVEQTQREREQVRYCCGGGRGGTIACLSASVLGVDCFLGVQGLLRPSAGLRRVL